MKASAAILDVVPIRALVPLSAFVSSSQRHAVHVPHVMIETSSSMEQPSFAVAGSLPSSGTCAI